MGHQHFLYSINHGNILHFQYHQYYWRSTKRNTAAQGSFWSVAKTVRGQVFDMYLTGSWGPQFDLKFVPRRVWKASQRVSRGRFGADLGLKMVKKTASKRRQTTTAKNIEIPCENPETIRKNRAKIASKWSQEGFQTVPKRCQKWSKNRSKNTPKFQTILKKGFHRFVAIFGVRNGVILETKTV